MKSHYIGMSARSPLGFNALDDKRHHVAHFTRDAGGREKTGITHGDINTGRGTPGIWNYFCTAGQ